MTQFFYTRKEPIKGTDPLEFKEFRDSFNVNKVIRTVMIDDGGSLVLIDDIHERTMDVPQYTPAGKPKGVKRERNTYQTEITLSKEDVERFFNLTNVK
jgi:hypothetical protein